MADFIKTSDLQERITFIDMIEDVDKYGRPIQKESEIFSCWASVRSQMLKDKVATIGTILENTITFVIRYEQVAKLQNTMKISWNNKKFEIVSIDEGYFKSDFTTIIAKEVSK
ncbi:phage head closure protein [Enterococcus sp. AZ102]|uniref:phage head closure protein n=1 Tax=Enterococcus sp. AZ102 TaxID=2774865 RepID=UPI003F2001DF